MHVILNYDAIAFSNVPHLEGDNLVQSLFGSADLPDSPVTQIWWNWGEGNHALYESAILEPSPWPRYRVFRDSGFDIIKETLEETRRRGLQCWTSYRINGSDADSGTPELPRYKQQHPEWTMARSAARSRHSSPLWNFEYKEVRQHKLDIIKELLDRYEWDGIEIDFARVCPVLRVGEAWQKRQCITAFMEQLREDTGKDFKIAVRVPETLAGCHFDGLEVERWGDIVDTFAVGCRSLEIGDWWRNCPIAAPERIVPVLDEVHASDGYHHQPIAVTRGVLSNWRHQGFGGVQFFNHQDADPRTDLAGDWEEAPWLEQRWKLHSAVYADIAAGLAGPKTYVVQRRGGGRAPVRSYPWDWDHPRQQYCNTNPEAQLPSRPPHAPMHIYVAEPGDGVLYIGMADRTPCRVHLNNIPLAEWPSDNGGIGGSFEVPVSALAAGDNLLEISAYSTIETIELTL